VKIKRRQSKLILALAVAGLAATPLAAQTRYDPGASDTEIKIGNIMPYTGRAAAYGLIGRTIAAYFKKINAEGERDTKLAVDALLHNPTSRPIQERLAELEKERDKAEARLADAAPPPISEFHPNMADSYRKKVQDLRAALAACDEADRADATAAIRELVEKVTIIPSDPYKPVQLKIHGRLATLLEASREGAIKLPESMGGWLRGVGFEPTTFRL
jgi:hypothetical protein